MTGQLRGGSGSAPGRVKSTWTVAEAEPPPWTCTPNAVHTT
ncbi:hypothetical protein [Umezawaea sp. Da 62-37]|nr:hypothetical protein [Umezawaea sp. Da 62-37]WNV85722.1 hypothetical protein RM788_47680 [Umezawaea sp. Da 62-37]